MRGLWMCLGLVCQIASSEAASLFDSHIFMPGPLVSAHADLEDQCSQCHGLETVDAACLNSHDEIAADIGDGAGFHGRIDSAHACTQCHTDHEGRMASVTNWIEATFDHDLTDFALRGAHRLLACTDCHAQSAPAGEPVRRRETSTVCGACHTTPHAEQVSLECGTCHSESGWKVEAFDHSATAFELTGAHANVACAACHVDTRFAPIDDHSCIACHAFDDEHRGGFGIDCAQCHTTSRWPVEFDHEKRADYALRGAHRELDCFACHGGALQSFAEDVRCGTCHAAVDVHAGALGNDCAQCHSETSWSEASFDHAGTGYALAGPHRDARCEQCHGNLTFQGAPRKCEGCHATQDPHGGAWHDCDACHVVGEWTATPTFDHGFAVFPLLGLHAAVPCFACHEQRGFVDAPTDCEACHGERDVHEGAFGPACESCHTPNGWGRVLFDHASTGFEIDGRHADLGCSACHKVRAGASGRLVNRTCNACHDRDDIHHGSFGRDCERCHVTSSFAEIRPGSLL